MKKFFWFALPLAIAVDMLALSKIFALISAPEDLAVWMGIVFLCIFLFLNYLFYRLLIKLKKQQ